MFYYSHIGFMYVIWTGKNEYGQVEIWVDGSRKTIDIVSYVLKVRVNGVTCVFVVHFRSSDTFSSL